MALNSINTNIGAYYAQSNIGKASTMASSSIARLSSGDRIVRAADDVAAMSAGTSLRTNVTTLRMAMINTSQGASLLQVADGALGQITDILQRQKAIAVQAGSGSLTGSERSFLNQEFQNLTEEIDRLVGQTNFNGVSLLDGSLSERVDLADVKTAAQSATGSITFQANPADTNTLVLNGATLEADSTAAAGVTAGHTAFTIGATIQETLDNLVTALNASTNVSLSQATYARSGNSLVITADNGGTQGEVYTIDANASSAISAANAAVVNAGGFSVTANLVSGNNIQIDAITDVAAVTGAANATNLTPFVVGETLTANLNGAGAANLYTIQAGDTLETIVSGINAGTTTHGLSARIVGTSGAYNIQFEAATGTVDTTYLAANVPTIVFGGIANTIGVANAINDAFNTAALVGNTTFYLDGGDDLGIGAGDTTGIGVIGDTLVADQTQLQSEISIIFPDIADGDLNGTTNFGQNPPVSILVAGVTFNFSNGGGATEAAIGSTLEDTLDNMVAAINSYEGSASEEYILNQLEVARDGNSLVFKTKDVGSAVDLTGAAATITYGGAGQSSVTGSSITNATAGVANVNTGQNSGVNTSGVTNDAFVGGITGFAATYGGTTNTVDVNITVGEYSYTAQNVNTNTTGANNQTIRFLSQDGGGYFDVQLRANNGEVVSSQSDANVFAQRLNAAFESLSFYQNREISSFVGAAPIITDGVTTGTLIGTSFELQTDDFSAPNIDYIRVNAPVGSSPNGSITISVDGEEYTTAPNIGDQLGANTSVEFINALDANKKLTFNTGNVAIEFDTDEKAAALEAALNEAFGVGDGSAELKFQVGTTVSDTLQVGINNVSTRVLYGGLSLDVLTAEAAATASATIDDALDIVTSVRAEVGALQSRFDFASANIESSIQNQDAARGILLDTDIAAESTQFATAQVQLQAGIAVLAQANLLPQNLLKLIG